MNGFQAHDGKLGADPASGNRCLCAAHDLVGKPVPAFRDHAPKMKTPAAGAGGFLFVSGA
jgi:hypothetical protein